MQILPISVTSEAIWGDGANVNFYRTFTWWIKYPLLKKLQY